MSSTAAVARSSRHARQLWIERLSFRGSIKKPSFVRTGRTRGTSFSTNSTIRILPSACRSSTAETCASFKVLWLLCLSFSAPPCFLLTMDHKRLPKPPYNPGVWELVKGKRRWSVPLTDEEIKRGFQGWHENGYLPHRDHPGLVQFVTFRLADAFPADLRAEWEHLLKIEDDRKRRIALEQYLDLGRGTCYLRRPEIAKIVEDSLLFRHGIAYDLRAWVVMPNHVHVLFSVRDLPMKLVVKDWKGYTAKEVNKVLRRKGQLWQEGYWDTFMRNDQHEIRARRYIENNPPKAKLAHWPKDWPWGSARFRDAYERLCLPQR